MSSDLVWAAARLLVSLPLVLGLAYLVLKYGLAKRYAVKPGNRRMKLVEQLPLGPKAILSLVELGGRYYLLAHQDSSISLIKEFDELPGPEDLEVGDVVELTPKTVEELDQMRKSGRAAVEEDFYGIRDGGRRAHLKELAKKTSKAKEFLKARVLCRGTRGEQK